MMVFVEGGKTEQKPSKQGDNNQPFQPQAVWVDTVDVSQ